MVTDRTDLYRHTGSGAVIPEGFKELSASLVSTCTFLQSLLQHVIYVTHGAELVAAKRTLKKFPNPRARIDFLCSFPYSEADPITSTVFNYSRTLFRDLYELRNILAHEVWSSSDAYEDSVIFSSLDEEAKLLMATGRVWHTDNAAPKEIFDATIRYIRSVKIVERANLHTAMDDANLCSWILMRIGSILNLQDAEKKEEARQLFLQYRGTSHLFASTPSSETLTFSASRSKTIQS